MHPENPGWTEKVPPSAFLDALYDTLENMTPPAAVRTRRVCIVRRLTSCREETAATLRRCPSGLLVLPVLPLIVDLAKRAVRSPKSVAAFFLGVSSVNSFRNLGIVPTSKALLVPFARKIEPHPRARAVTMRS